MIIIKLNSSIIYSQLSKQVSLKSNQSQFKNVELDRPLLYAGEFIQENRLYVVSTMDLDSIPKNLINSTLLCIGEPRFNYEDVQFDLLIVPLNTQINRLFNQVQEIFDFFDLWDTQLQDIVYRNLGITQMLEISEKIFNNPLVLIDQNFNYVSYSKDFALEKECFRPESEGRLPLEIVNELITDQEFLEAKNKRDVFLFPSYPCEQNELCFNIKNQDIFVARLLLLQRNKSFSHDDSVLLRHLGNYIQKVFNLNNSFSPIISSFNNVHQLLEDSLNRLPQNAEIANKILHEVNWQYNHSFLVIKIQLFSKYEHDLSIPYLCKQLEAQWKGSCAIKYQSVIVVLINQTIYSDLLSNEFYQELAYFLREGVFKAGISCTFNDFSKLYLYYLQAEIALNIGNSIDETFWHYHFNDYVLHYILRQCAGNLTFEQICSPGLLKLKKHDEMSSTQYYKTLRMYFEKKYNAAQASSALYIHRSTFLDRMKRIQEISNLDLNNWSTRLHVLLSFHLLDELEDG